MKKRLPKIRIPKKTIHAEEFGAYMFRLRDILDNLPMTQKQRDDIWYCLGDIEEKFNDVNK